MNGLVDIESRDLSALSELYARLPEIADQAAQLAINDTARFARREGKKDVLEQINYPKSYLDGDEGRLRVSKFATEGDLEAEVTGRDRPTSLARFAVGKVSFGRRKAIRVQVKRGGAKHELEHSFYMKLKRGTQLDGENFNVGLAVRLKKGESLANSTAALNLGNGLYLLYGPSVNQVFEGVAGDIVDEVSDKLEDEFIRQFERLSP